MLLFEHKNFNKAGISALTLPDLSLLLSTTPSGGGGVGQWTPSLLTHKPFFLKASHLVGVLGLSFKVSRMLELVKLRLYGNDDNHSTTKCFLPIIVKM